ncbi:MAG: DedA family protein [Elusimicrobiaceae bacterium]|nr:DedA family protein [Elusimicrobiaceae bacterium]
MEFITQIIDIFLHLDAHLNTLAATLGPWLYAVLFAVIFCETGLVVTPFLPGDSLIFAVGALASIKGSVINLPLIWVLLICAAILGDAVNYTIGKFIGPKVFTKDTGKLLNKKHLLAAHAFYEKYGGKTIILARFIPIIRTFAPFVAGIGKMSYLHFALYNVIGAVLWVSTFCLGGYFFGSTEVVQKHFHYIIVAIIIISVLPAVFEYIKAKRENKKV